MAENKSHIFSEDRQRIAIYCDAMSHPARAAILELLAENGRLSCSELTELLPLAQPTVSQHLARLRKAGLVQFEKEGLSSLYEINPEVTDEMRRLFYELINKVSNPL
jgi:ArsR family transcriptional regulator, arsenate/arsenite/antimonite-responsive transcriptional repressor